MPSAWLRLGTSLLVFLLLFQLVVPLQIFGLSLSFLHYPADGEAQASENFVRIFLVLVPTLAALSFFVPGLFLAAVKPTAKTQRTLGVGFAAATLSLTGVVVVAELAPAEILLAVSVETLVVFGAVEALLGRTRRRPSARPRS